MKFFTYSPRIVDFWKERVCDVIKRFLLDGIETWQIVVDDNHPDLKDPRFVQLKAEEVLQLVPEVIGRRLAPPLFTLKVNKHFATVVDRAGQNGIPLSKTPLVLRRMCENASGNAKVVRLPTRRDIHRVICRNMKNGMKTVLHFITPGTCEPFSAELVLSILKAKGITQKIATPKVRALQTVDETEEVPWDAETQKVRIR